MNEPIQDRSTSVDSGPLVAGSVALPELNGDSSHNPLQKKELGWLAATLPVAFISALAELALGILNNSALPVYFKNGLGLDTFILTIVSLPFYLSEVLFKSPLGVLADRWGRKPLMILGPAVSIFTPLVLIHTNYPQGTITPHLLILFGFLRLLDGFGAAALWPAMFAYIGDHVRDEKRTKAMSLLNVTYMLGLALGFLAGGWVNDTFGPVLSGEATLRNQMVIVYSNIKHHFHHHAHKVHHGFNLHPSSGGLYIPETIYQPAQYHPSFYLASVLFALATCVAVLALKSSAADKALHAAQNSTESDEKIDWQSFVSAIKSVPELMLIAFVTFFGIGNIALLVKLFALDELGVSETDFGLLVLWPAVLIGSLAIPLGHLSDKFGKVRSVRGGFFTAAVGMWTIVLLFHLPGVRDLALIIGGSLLGMGFVIAFPAWMAHLTTVGSASRRGTIVGVVSTAQGVGMMLGALSGGWLYSHVSSDPHVAHIAPFAASAVLLTISAAMTVFMISDKKATQTGQTEAI